MDLAPVEYVIIEFPSDQADPDVARAIADLVERRVVRILDLVFVRKGADGSVTWFEYDELDELAIFAEIDGEVDGLMGDEDIAELAEDLPPEHSALFIVWEDLWATDLGHAVRRAGGRVVAGERIPYEIVQAALADDA